MKGLKNFAIFWRKRGMKPYFFNEEKKWKLFEKFQIMCRYVYNSRVKSIGFPKNSIQSDGSGIWFSVVIYVVLCFGSHSFQRL